MISNTYKPVTFFLITFLGSWIPWFLAALLSYQKADEKLQLFCVTLGMFVPCIAALIMIYGSKNRGLVQDFWNRIFLFRMKLSSFLFIVLLMPSVLFLATGLSLLFGLSLEQFALANEYHVIKGWRFLSLVMPFFLAPMLEELGWRGYGVDSLRVNFNLFKTSMLFAFLWAMWHLPIFFINGFYHHELWNQSMLYVINFFVSIVPASILLNWIYYKNGRSIPAAILFHSMLNVFSVLFQTEQFTKCIITVLLFAVSVVVILKNKNFFFNNFLNFKT